MCAVYGVLSGKMQCEKHFELDLINECKLPIKFLNLRILIKSYFMSLMTPDICKRLMTERAENIQ